MSDLNALQTEVGLIHPTYLVISAGTNNASGGDATATYISEVNSMISYCVSYDIIPILMEILPRTGSNATIDAYNVAINLLKYRIIACNATLKSAGVLSATFDSGDGLHPNSIGHFEVAQKIISSTYDIVEYDFTYDNVNGSNYFRSTNPNTGTSSSVRWEQMSDAGISVIQTSSAAHSFTSWANRLALANSAGGVIMTAYGTSGTLNFQTGGFNARMNIGATGLARFGDGTGGTAQLEVAQPVSTTGSAKLLLLTGGAHTTQTLSTELTDIHFNLARTVQFATGALTTQRAVRLQAPTYAFVGASTITNATTFEISGAPVAGTNATITTPLAFNVASGTSALVGSVVTGATNGTAPAASAQLDVVSTTKGFLPPRMTTTQRDAISSPATGLMIFNTDATATDASTGTIQVWNGSVWKNAW